MHKIVELNREKKYFSFVFHFIRNEALSTFEELVDPSKYYYYLMESNVIFI